MGVWWFVSFVESGVEDGMYCGIERLRGELVGLESRGDDVLVMERRYCGLNMAN